MLVISRREVEQLLNIDELIDALAIAMADLSGGRASVPKRTIAAVQDRGILGAMPAYLATSNELAAKLVLVFHANAEKGIPTHQAIIAVFDPVTGVPAAVMDGAYITAMRTAAGSALATRLCAREDASVLAIIGTGVQARAHAKTLPRVRNIKKIIVAGRSAANVKEFAAELGGDVANNYEDAVRAADIICACTNSTDPIVRREWLRPGVHVNSVGFARGPELEPAVFADTIVVVESRSAVIGEFPNGAADLTEAVNNKMVELASICEIGEVVAEVRHARTNAAQITVYRSVGVAAQDVAAAGLVMTAARKRGLGTEVDLA